MTAHRVFAHFQMPEVEDNNNTAPLQPQPAVHVHLHSPSHKRGLKFHTLTNFHDPHTSGFLSAESAESAEVVAVSPAAAVVSAGDAVPVGDSGSAMESSKSRELLIVFKRDLDNAAAQTAPTTLQLCPGKIRYF